MCVINGLSEPLIPAFTALIAPAAPPSPPFLLSASPPVLPFVPVLLRAGTAEEQVQNNVIC